mgnify:FL=1
MPESESHYKVKELIDHIISNINTYSKQEICNLNKAVENSFNTIAKERAELKEKFSSDLDARHIDQLIDTTLTTKSYLFKLKKIVSKRDAML